ncbi:MAG TPA: 2-C-methyl-D-erythritol 4-phosphate cytidylyltransferase, partial [Microvirga sp.]|nr:2-C-methyl-D-erythritol 4-phosphate cytidylyltransferase [Microvirga sp.]
MSVAALIVAAGRGSRAGEGVPKQYRVVQNQPVLAKALSIFLSHPGISYTAVVIHPDDREFYDDTIRALPSPPSAILPCVHGGATRQISVRNGLEALVDLNPEIVLVHDAARPFAGPDLIDRAIEAGKKWGAAVPGTPVTDTIKVIGERSEVLSTPDRSKLRAVQTPQAFRFPLLLDAHRSAAAANLDTFTDDGALAEWAGLPVHVFKGDADNTKLTHPADFREAERRSKGEKMTYV